MKVKELIEKLQKCNLEREDDEIGYVLEPILVIEIYEDEVGIYAKYTATKEDCDFIGQVDLKEAYQRMKQN